LLFQVQGGRLLRLDSKQPAGSAACSILIQKVYLEHMVRVSGFLDEGTDVRRISVDSFRGRHENSLATRRLQRNYPSEHASDQAYRGVVDNDSFRQERRSRRPQPQHFGTNSTSSQQMKHQSIVEMKPLLSDSESKSSILEPLTSETKYYDVEVSSNNNTATSSGTQATNHRNLHYGNPTANQVPGGPTRLLAPCYHTQVSDDEEGDIVCCDDCYQHEGTKNICTIFIWAIAVFFIMNRFFVHMSNYLRQDGDEVKTDRIVNAGSNYSSNIAMNSGP
jgi:hypothetical protein